MAEQEQRQGEQVKGSWASWVSVTTGPAASDSASGRLPVTSFQAGPLAGMGAQEVTALRGPGGHTVGSRPPNNTQAKKEGLIPAAVGLMSHTEEAPEQSKSNRHFKQGPHVPRVTLLPLMSQVLGNQQHKEERGAGGEGQPPVGLLIPGVILGALERSPPCTLHTHTPQKTLYSQSMSEMCESHFFCSWALYRG